MTDLLAGAGLAPAPSDDGTAAEPVEPAAPVETPTPAAPAETAPAASAETDDEIVVPAGAENPDAVRNLIANERKAAKDANARARQLEAQLRERENAARPLEDQLSDAQSAASEAALRALRIEIGVGKGLSLTMAKRLSGTTEAEIAADADVVAAELGTTPAPTPVLPGASADGGFQTPPPAAKPNPEADHGQFLGAILAANRGQ